VSDEFPTGQSWEVAYEPTHHGVTAAAPGAVWALCNDGDVCVRTGYTELEVYGTDWEIIQSVDGNAIHISVGENYQTWMINGHNVYFRTGMQPNDRMGTGW
jgi:hypothetical protein